MKWFLNLDDLYLKYPELVSRIEGHIATIKRIYPVTVGDSLECLLEEISCNSPAFLFKVYFYKNNYQYTHYAEIAVVMRDGNFYSEIVNLGIA